MTKQYKGPVRIKDIARKAGVSTGTVDRVIHGRGKVSSENERKVKEAIAILEYEPNIVARSLAMNSNFKIAVLLPNYKKDSFWLAQLKGIERAMDYIKDFGFSIRVFDFDDQKHGDLLKHCDEIFSNKYNAILMAPTLKDDAHLFLDKCSNKEIPYLLVNTNLLRTDNFYIGYVGQNSYQSGKLAAKLLSLMTVDNGSIAVFHMEKEVENRAHMLQKEKGFRSFFQQSETKPKLIITETIPKIFSKKKLKKNVKAILEKNNNLKGIFVTTSRIHLLVQALQELEKSDIMVVGFDLIEENINALHSYDRMILINQRPDLQGYTGLISLFNFLLKKKNVSQEHHLPLDVITKENVSAYLQS